MSQDSCPESDTVGAMGRLKWSRVPHSSVIRRTRLDWHARCYKAAKEDRGCYRTGDHSPIEIHAENELHMAVERFFDEVIYSVARGYESRAASSAA